MTIGRYKKSLQQRIEKKQSENESSRSGILDALRQISKELPDTFPSITGLALSGSVVSGDFTMESDVDVVVTGLKKDEYFKLHNYLEAGLKRNIDLIMEEDLSKKDKEHLLRRKETIYVRKKN